MKEHQAIQEVNKLLAKIERQRGREKTYCHALEKVVEAYTTNNEDKMKAAIALCEDVLLPF